MEKLASVFDGDLLIDSAYGVSSLCVKKKGQKPVKVLSPFYLDDMHDIVENLTNILTNSGYYKEDCIVCGNKIKSR